jgi:hypothetical protein
MRIRRDSLQSGEKFDIKTKREPGATDPRF